MDKQYLQEEFDRFFDFPTDDKSEVSSVSARLFVEHMAKPIEAQVETLRAVVIECRSSVKFDLTHYEKMARAYGNLGAEGAQTSATAEAEAQRLHELLEKIDALALTPPNAGNERTAD